GHPPNQRVMLTHQPRDGQDRHHFRQLHDKGFKEQGEAAVRSGPGNSHTVDAATGTVDARSAGMQVSLMLKEVQVAPPQNFCVVGLASLRALRTWERGATGKVEVDIEATRLH